MKLKFLMQYDLCPLNNLLFSVQISVSPNPFLQGVYFNQTLDFSTATIYVYAGGSSITDYSVGFSVWIDANSDALFVTANSPTGTPFAFTATVSSTRPDTVWQYNLSFESCKPAQANPDVFVDPIPVFSKPFLQVPSQSAKDAIRYGSGRNRPLRRLFEQGKLKGSVSGYIQWL